MASWLDRFDEVWAEIENLPSPYVLRSLEQREIQRIAASQILEMGNLNYGVLEMMRRNGVIENYKYDRQSNRVFIQPTRALEYIEWSFTDSPADLPVPSGGTNVQQ